MAGWMAGWDRWMDGWLDGYVGGNGRINRYRCICIWEDRGMFERTDGWMDGRGVENGWIVGWMDDGWLDR